MTDTIPALERTITLPDMVAYAGATWDWHRLHYDLDMVREAGLQGPVVDGQVLGALMAEQLCAHFGPQTFVRELGFRFASMVFAGDTVRITAEVTGTGEGTVSVAQTVHVGDRVAATGTAVVRV